MAKSMTVRQAGRKGGNATRQKWKTNKRFAEAMRKKLSTAGKKSARVRKKK